MKNSMRIGRRTVVASLLVSVAALIAALGSWGWGPRRYLAWRWGRELPGLPDERVSPRLRQIAGLGEAGLPVLVDALGSDRDRVVSSASAVLQEQLTRWRRLAARDSSPKAACLARLLASRVDSFSLAGRAAAARLATRLLLWPIDRRTIDGGRLVADCETVVRASPLGALPPATIAIASEKAEPSGGRAATAALRSAGGPNRGAVSETASDPRPPQRKHLEARAESSSTRDSGGAVLSAASAGSSPRRPDRAPSLFSPPPAEVLSPVVTPSSASREASQDPEAPGAVRRGGFQAGQSPWTMRSDREVIERLGDDDPLIAGEALRELERRGYGERELDLARRLISPDPRQRRAVAEAAVRLNGLDARPWLIWLSRDEDPNVRRAAAAIMATSRDPELHKRLRAMAQQEPDEDLRAQLQKLPALWR